MSTGCAPPKASGVQSPMMQTVNECLKDIPTKVQKTYDACLASKDVLYYPSEVIKEDNQLRTEIRLCESLAKKPGPSPSQINDKTPSVKEAAETAQDKQKEQAKDPEKDVFDPENWDSLLIDQFDGQQGEEYGILLNKYAVVPLHSVMVTKHWEAQTSPLSPPQLLAAYQMIQAFADGHRKEGSPFGDLLVFYNCGEMSGASQQHKHLQFAPMHGEGSIGHFPTEAAAERVSLSEQELKKPFYLPGVPYAHHVRRISLPSSSPTSAFDKPQEVMSYLAQVYMSLLDAMIDNLRSLAEAQHPSGQEEQKQHIPTKVGKGLSYNLLMTKKHMHMIPRREATYRLPEPKDPKGLGATTTEPAIVGCNALAYTGTVLVKSKQDIKRLQEGGGVLGALEACAWPIADHEVADVSVDE